MRKVIIEISGAFFSPNYIFNIDMFLLYFPVYTVRFSGVFLNTA